MPRKYETALLRLQRSNWNYMPTHNLEPMSVRSLTNKD